LWGAAAGGLALAWRGAHLWHWAVFALLVALVPAVEALNTAIEILTDHISPGWSQTAKRKGSGLAGSGADPGRSGGVSGTGRVRSRLIRAVPRCLHRSGLSAAAGHDPHGGRHQSVI
jgi:hypothetical protein